MRVLPNNTLHVSREKIDMLENPINWTEQGQGTIHECLGAEKSIENFGEETLARKERKSTV